MILLESTFKYTIYFNHMFLWDEKNFSSTYLWRRKPAKEKLHHQANFSSGRWSNSRIRLLDTLNIAYMFCQSSHAPSESHEMQGAKTPCSVVWGVLCGRCTHTHTHMWQTCPKVHHLFWFLVPSPSPSIVFMRVFPCEYMLSCTLYELLAH